MIMLISRTFFAGTREIPASEANDDLIFLGTTAVSCARLLCWLGPELVHDLLRHYCQLVII